MEVFHLVRGQTPQRIEAPESMPADGYIWLDFVRSEADELASWPQRLLGTALDPRHLQDSRDAAHRAFFDVAPGYDLLVFEEIVPQGEEQLRLETRGAALFLFERLLISVHEPDSAGFGALKYRFAQGTTRSPGSVRVLAQILLDEMADRLLAIGENFNQRLEDLQASLLDPRSPFNDWAQLLDGRRDAYRLEWLCKHQLKTLERWHRNSVFEWSNPEETRLHDIAEHITLLRDAAADLERHVEAAVQIYFAATAHRTNDIVRTLTVFSAIFLPLTFVAGVYGMNFAFMPELELRFAYPAVLVVMLLVAVLLLRYFRRRGYF
ncbi:magnesium transporter CorA family protein [Fontimonas sp. SYSU GA230001]|uniref:magnesium transporter CorA family protein n=1 Tax=Fontimonas sp. SYSU GA230001 TaxID=3142450 RepID=UPI0032B36740